MTKGKNTLRGEMAKYGITIREMAGKLGISTPSMWGKLNGKTDFTLTEVKKVLSFFRSVGENHSIEYLFDIKV